MLDTQKPSKPTASTLSGDGVKPCVLSKVKKIMFDSKKGSPRRDSLVKNIKQLTLRLTSGKHAHDQDESHQACKARATADEAVN